MNSHHSVEHPSLTSSLTAEELAGIDRRYSNSVLALSSYDSLIEQGCSPLEADEILQILKSDPDVCSDITNGHWVGSDDLGTDEANVAVDVEVKDPLIQLEHATDSCLHRYAPANDLFVADNAAWVKGFNPAAFERHVERTRKAQRYHGIEDIVFDKAGRVRSVRKLIKRAA
jgi:hypothetical protein